MREIIKAVAEIINELRTLNLVQENDVHSALAVDQDLGSVLIVLIKSTAYVLDYCLTSFQELRSSVPCVMTIGENNGIVLSVSFSK